MPVNSVGRYMGNYRYRNNFLSRYSNKNSKKTINFELKSKNLEFTTNVSNWRIVNSIVYWICLFPQEWPKVSLFNKNVDPIIFGICNRKNSLFITQGTLQFPCKSWIFPMNGLAWVVKNNFPMSGEATNWEIIFYYDC